MLTDIPFFFVISVAVLSLNFFPNVFNSSPEIFYKLFQKDSEALVIGKIANSARMIDFTPLGYFEPDTPHFNNWVQLQYDIIYQNLNTSSFSFNTYKSQFGLQGFIWNLIYKQGLVKSPQLKIYWMWMLNSIILALVLSFFILWVFVEWGFYYAVIALLTTCGSTWLTVFGRNLYWMTSLWFLPFVCSLWYYRAQEKGVVISHKVFFMSIVLSIMVKSLCGYEYISTIVVASLCPIVYYSIKNTWKLEKILKSILFVIAASSIGFFTALFLHVLSMEGGLEFVWNRILARSFYLGQPDTDTTVKLGLHAPLLFVIMRYFVNSMALGMGIKTICSFYIGFLVIISCMFYSFYMLFRVRSTLEKKEIALLWTFLFSFLAPISWHILMKAHSYHHTHMNYVLWHLPFTLYGYLVVFMFASRCSGRLSVSIRKIVKCNQIFKNNKR